MNSSAATADATPRSLRAFTNALAQGRLAHAILVHGDHPPALEAACLGLAGKLLDTADAGKHPDFFSLRPSGKMRFIKVDSLLDFLNGPGTLHRWRADTALRVSRARTRAALDSLRVRISREDGTAGRLRDDDALLFTAR